MAFAFSISLARNEVWSSPQTDPDAAPSIARKIVWRSRFRDIMSAKASRLPRWQSFRRIWWLGKFKDSFHQAGTNESKSIILWH
jgi:hypothetical protein